MHNTQQLHRDGKITLSARIFCLRAEPRIQTGRARARSERVYPGVRVHMHMGMHGQKTADRLPLEPRVWTAHGFTDADVRTNARHLK